VAAIFLLSAEKPFFLLLRWSATSDPDDFPMQGDPSQPFLLFLQDTPITAGAASPPVDDCPCLPPPGCSSHVFFFFFFFFFFFSEKSTVSVDEWLIRAPGVFYKDSEFAHAIHGKRFFVVLWVVSFVFFSVCPSPWDRDAGGFRQLGMMFLGTFFFFDSPSSCRQLQPFSRAESGLRILRIASTGSLQQTFSG